MYITALLCWPADSDLIELLRGCTRATATQPPLARRRGGLRAPPQTAERSAALSHGNPPSGPGGSEPEFKFLPTGPGPREVCPVASSRPGPVPAMETQSSHLCLLSDPHGTVSAAAALAQTHGRPSALRLTASESVPLARGSLHFSLPVLDPPTLNSQ